MIWQGFSNRKFPRIDSDIAIIMIQESSNTTLSAQIKNIGVGGLCVVISKQVKIYDTVEVSFQLPILEKSITCKAQVVWTVKTFVEEEPVYDVGLQFICIKKQDKDHCNRFVESLSSAEQYNNFPPSDENDSKEEQLA